MNSGVFLDRDGVVNKIILKERRPYSPRKLDQLEILDGVRDAVKILKKLGFKVVVVTNQPEISRGLITEDLIMEMHNKISEETGIESFYFCRHDDFHDCECRKPKTGMLLRAAVELDLDFNQSYLVGDRWKDIQAGQKVGCKCYFIDNNYDEPRPIFPFRTVKSLYEAAILIRESRSPD
jgi:D-glycero-D-manno-heptose 1,7-bisphosphate phosphatase